MPSPSPTPQGPIFLGNAPQLDWAEVVNQTNLQQGLCEVLPPVDLERRKLYAWMAINASNTADNYVKAVIQFYRQNGKVGSLPLEAGASSGANSVVKSSLVSITTVSGSNVADSIGFTVSNPQTWQVPSLVLQPSYHKGRIDRVTIDLLSWANVTAVRLFLAVVSNPL